MHRLNRRPRHFTIFFAEKTQNKMHNKSDSKTKHVSTHDSVPLWHVTCFTFDARHRETATERERAAIVIQIRELDSGYSIKHRQYVSVATNLDVNTPWKNIKTEAVKLYAARGLRAQHTLACLCHASCTIHVSRCRRWCRWLLIALPPPLPPPHRALHNTCEPTTDSVALRAQPWKQVQSKNKNLPDFLFSCFFQHLWSVVKQRREHFQTVFFFFLFLCCISSIFGNQKKEFLPVQCVRE